MSAKRKTGIYNQVHEGVEHLVKIIDTVVMCRKANECVHTSLLDTISRTTNEKEINNSELSEYIYIEIMPF